MPLKLNEQDPCSTKVQVNGRPAGIYEVDERFVFGWFISSDGEKCSRRWHPDGTFYSFCTGYQDLVNAPEQPVTIYRYLNIYEDDRAALASISRQQADGFSACSQPLRIACVRVPITYVRGQFDE